MSNTTIKTPIVLTCSFHSLYKNFDKSYHMKINLVLFGYHFHCDDPWYLHDNISPVSAKKQNARW